MANADIDFDKYNNFAHLDESQFKTSGALANHRLKRASAVFRHGHRTPIKYPESESRSYQILDATFFPHLNTSCFDEKQQHLYSNVQLVPSDVESLKGDQVEAMLTTKGARQLNDVGVQLGDRYYHFLTSGNEKVQDSLLTVTTPTKRTLESLLAVLKGLLRRSSESPSVKVNVLSELLTNYLFIPFARFPELRQGREKGHSYESKCKYVSGYREWATDMERRSGIVAEGLDIQHVRDFLTCYETFDMTHLCSWMLQEDVRKSERFCSYTVTLESLMAEDGKGVEKSAHLFFENLLNFFKSEHDHKLCLYSGHDSTINFIRLALRAQDYTWPDFGFNVEFELYEHLDTGDLKLLILFNFKPVVLKSISQEALIPLAVFEQFVHNDLSIHVD